MATTASARRLPASALALAAVLGFVPTGALAGGRAPASRPAVEPADLAAVRKAIVAPGARAVLVNVWATWCEPCREELPDLLRVYEKNRGRGLRLVLVSADAPRERDEVAKVLGALGVGFPSYVKTGDDQAFIDGLDRRWEGAIPASFLFDPRASGPAKVLWQRKITAAELQSALDGSGLLAPAPAK
jgi:thiol-disulfide isomerase/thioredoxin